MYSNVNLIEGRAIQRADEEQPDRQGMHSSM